MPKMFRGFPVWLKYVPGISFRTDNEPFKTAMQGFTTKIVNLMKSVSSLDLRVGWLYSPRENEYGPLDQNFGNPGYQYMTWAANMVVGMGTGVPLAEHEDIDDAVGLEEPTERDHGVDLQQPLLIKIYSSDNHQK
ncbi:hypothetical protein OROGR_026652 [Orobanche gracilis]